MIMASAVLDRVFNPILFFLRAVGLWTTGDSYTVGYTVYAVLIILTFPTILTLTMLIQMLLFTEKEEASENMYMALTHSAFLFKIVNFACRWQSMQSAYRTVCIFELGTVDEVKYFKRKMRNVYVVTVMFLTSANIANLGAALKAFFSTENLLTYPAWYPGQWSNGGVKYVLVFVHQFIGGCLSCNLHSAMEMYTNIMLLSIGVQLDILGMRLHAIGYVVADDSMSTNMQRIQHLEKLINCIRLHRKILTLSIRHLSPRNSFVLLI